eukprot:CAMPEP_0170189742 /NCGR_PEP_ID=MMETSP0040_2-20121228/47589_1 /TAXON_ID=641309 /ORGANISM="Lotharella oceanica, Strain CCMP622" /LENGTH=81 /DNA_ID=CAMNT_0010437395 /DNA_START=331 /DNA_END=576 /DNA_ORIENTATION=-
MLAGNGFVLERFLEGGLMDEHVCAPAKTRKLLARPAVSRVGNAQPTSMANDHRPRVTAMLHTHRLQRLNTKRVPQALDGAA